jgi:hypothetical protein
MEKEIKKDLAAAPFGANEIMSALPKADINNHNKIDRPGVAKSVT